MVGEHLAQLDAPLRALRQPRQTHRLPRLRPLRHAQQHAQALVRLLHAHHPQLRAHALRHAGDLLAQRHLHQRLLAARREARHLVDELLQVRALAAQHVHDRHLVQLRRGVQRAERVPLAPRVQKTAVARELLDAGDRVVHQRVAQGGLSGEAVQVGVGAVVQQDAHEGRGVRLARQHQRCHALRVLHVHQTAQARRRCRGRMSRLAENRETPRVAVEHGVHEHRETAHGVDADARARLQQCAHDLRVVTIHAVKQRSESVRVLLVHVDWLLQQRPHFIHSAFPRRLHKRGQLLVHARRVKQQGTRNERSIPNNLTGTWIRCVRFIMDLYSECHIKWNPQETEWRRRNRSLLQNSSFACNDSAGKWNARLPVLTSINDPIPTLLTSLTNN